MLMALQRIPPALSNTCEATDLVYPPSMAATPSVGSSCSTSVVEDGTYPLQSGDRDQVQKEEYNMFHDYLGLASQSHVGYANVDKPECMASPTRSRSTLLETNRLRHRYSTGMPPQLSAPPTCPPPQEPLDYHVAVAWPSNFERHTTYWASLKHKKALGRPKSAKFSHAQVYELEQRFKVSKHIDTVEEREQLATKLSLTEAQVRVWFQNRRRKDKKEQQLKQARLSLGCKDLKDCTPCTGLFSFQAPK